MKKLYPTLLLGAAGCIAGAATGVAAFGTAVSGAFVFGPIALIMGWFISQPKAAVPPGSSQSEMSNDVPLAKEFNEFTSEATSLVRQIGWLLARLWNLIVHALDAVGLLAYCERRPWLLLVLGVLLLIVFLPLGLVFAACYFAASQYGASADSHFIAQKFGPDLR